MSCAKATSDYWKLADKVGVPRIDFKADISESLEVSLSDPANTQQVENYKNFGSRLRL